MWFLHNPTSEPNQEIRDIVLGENIKVTLNQLFGRICPEQFKQEQFSHKSNRMTDTKRMLNIHEWDLLSTSLPCPLILVAGVVTMFLVFFWNKAKLYSISENQHISLSSWNCSMPVLLKLSSWLVE